mmetsp:Transcript_5123/g.14628  ORF Transcript_5123/g.14628 Transcript_5123/m.14628 type:complete len:322 (+) Transcript_5123:323-1288(+)
MTSRSMEAVRHVAMTGAKLWGTLLSMPIFCTCRVSGTLSGMSKWGRPRAFRDCCASAETCCAICCCMYLAVCCSGCANCCDACCCCGCGAGMWYMDGCGWWICGCVLATGCCDPCRHCCACWTESVRSPDANCGALPPPRVCRWQKSHNQLLRHERDLLFSNMHGRQALRLPNLRCTTEPKESGKPSGLASVSSFVSERKRRSPPLLMKVFWPGSPSPAACSNQSSLMLNCCAASSEGPTSTCVGSSSSDGGSGSDSRNDPSLMSPALSASSKSPAGASWRAGLNVVGSLCTNLTLPLPTGLGGFAAGRGAEASWPGTLFG